MKYLTSNPNQNRPARIARAALIASVIGMLWAVGSGGSVHAATITVTSTADSGAGTLRDALASAADGDTIDATGISGTITLTMGELVVTNSVTIVGPGPATLAVDGNFPATTNRVFHINNHPTVVIAGLTLAHGATDQDNSGAGVFNEESTLTLSNCVITANSTGGAGGGIFNNGVTANGALMLVNCALIGNSAILDGGGVANLGIGGGRSATVAIQGCTFSGNTASNNGGGVYSAAISGAGTMVTISSSVISSNVAASLRTADGGGGVCNIANLGGSATVAVSASTISGNQVNTAGGGILSGARFAGVATLNLITSRVSTNSAAVGGGIASIGGIATNADSAGTALLMVSNSTLAANIAGFVGSGIANEAAVSGTATATVIASTLDANGSYMLDGFPEASGENGGGILNSGDTSSPATLTVTYSTLSHNTTSTHFGDEEGGAIANYLGAVTLMNSTISGNSAGDAGGIYNAGGYCIDTNLHTASICGPATVTVLNCTFSDNSVSEEGSAGAILNYLGDVTIGSTILKYGAFGENLLNACQELNLPVPDPVYGILYIHISLCGRFTSRSSNLSDDFADGWFLGGDLVNTDPMLGPLQNNGGPTFTHALLPGSPAIDQGNNFTGSATDQRGFPRTVDDPATPNRFGFGDGTDIGAFELQNFPPVALCSNVTVMASAGCAANASINAGSHDPNAGGTITLSQSPTGPYPAGTTLVTLTAVNNYGLSDSCQANVTVLPVADVAISKAVVNGQGKPGQTLIYTLVVANVGPCSASGVVATDVVPLGTTYVSASPKPTSAPQVGSGGAVTWNLGSSNSGGHTNLTLTVKVSTTGNPQIANTATVTSATFDPNPANNTATISTTRNAK